MLTIITKLNSFVTESSYHYLHLLMNGKDMKKKGSHFSEKKFEEKLTLRSNFHCFNQSFGNLQYSQIENW
jgi:hypothetical protein